MADHYNNLTPKQMELLSMLAEEAGEIVQAAMKAQRHGLESQHPDGGPDNRIYISMECGDLIGVITACIKAGIIEKTAMTVSAQGKMERAKPYLHHQDN
jgi:hypothetical protein